MRGFLGKLLPTTTTETTTREVSRTPNKWKSRLVFVLASLPFLSPSRTNTGAEANDVDTTTYEEVYKELIKKRGRKNWREALKDTFVHHQKKEETTGNGGKDPDKMSPPKSPFYVDDAGNVHLNAGF